MRGGIADARQLSRAAGISRLRAEAAYAGFELARATEAIRSETRRDIARAREFARSYARGWLRHAEGETVRQAVEAASANTLGSLRRTAVTESSEAFNSGRSKAALQLPPLGLLKVWDATLDKRTCPICSAADGTIVGIREPFPLGEPGAIHPFDRCCFTILRTTDDARGTLIEPAPVQPVRSFPSPLPALTPPLASPPVPRAVPRAARRPAATADRLLAPLPAVAAPAQPLIDGISERSLKFFREGYRAKLRIYEDVPLSQVDAVATGRMNPPGSSTPLPPITIGVYAPQPGGTTEFHLLDGRHRMEAAQNALATRIRAKIRVFGPRGGIKWEGDRDIPLPTPDPMNRHGRN